MSLKAISTIYLLLIGFRVLVRKTQCFVQLPINTEFHSPQDYYRGNWFQAGRFRPNIINNNNVYENRDVRFDDFGSKLRTANQVVFSRISTPQAHETRFETLDRFRDNPQRLFSRKPLFDRKVREDIAAIRVNGKEVRVHRVPDDGITPKGAILLRLEELKNVGEPVKVFISQFVPGVSNDKLPSRINDSLPKGTNNLPSNTNEKSPSSSNNLPKSTNEKSPSSSSNVVATKDLGRYPYKKFIKTTVNVQKMLRVDQPSPTQYSQLDPTYHVEARTSNPLRPLPKPFQDIGTTESPNSIASHFARGAVERRFSQPSDRSSRILELSNHLRNEKPFRSSQQASYHLPNVPRTSFSCSRQLGPGYYADMELDCQVFHTCDREKRKNSFFCPNGTLFSQVVLVCDWEQNVECGESELFYNKNIATYDEAHQLKT